MLPTSSRVKLNRVALKDVVGLKLAPQRRRPVKAQVKTSTKSPKQEKMSVSDFVPEEDAASRSGSSKEPLKSVLIHGGEPASGAGTPCSVGGKLEQNTCTELQCCPGGDMERKQHGPNTRGKYEQQPSSRGRDGRGDPG